MIDTRNPLNVIQGIFDSTLAKNGILLHNNSVIFECEKIINKMV